MFGEILTGVSAISGLLGGGKSKQTSQQQSGYVTLTPEAKKIMESLLPRIGAWGQTPYATVPYQRYTNQNPIFGSPQLAALQRLNDVRTMQQYASTPSSPVAATSGGGDYASALNNMILRDMMKAGAGTKSANLYERALNNANLESLGKQFYSANQRNPYNFQDLARWSQGNDAARQEYLNMMGGRNG